MDKEVSRFTNPHHPVPDEVTEGLVLYHQLQEQEIVRQQELVELARPQRDEMEYKSNVQKAALQAIGIDPEDYQARRREWNARRLRLLDDYDLSHGPIDFGPWYPDMHHPPPPPPTDPSFWEADGELWATPPYGGEWQSNGGHFRGKYTYDGASTVNRYFGARWRLELHSNRIPPSPSGRWRSAPHIGLHGSLLGYVGDGDVFSGDRWANCWMHTRQTLFHFPFGPSVNDRRQIIEAKETRSLIFLQHSLTDDSDIRSFGLPGTVSMPAVEFNRDRLFAGYSIWAELEVYFHVQLEGNSLMWINGDILLQTFQWPLQAL